MPQALEVVVGGQYGSEAKGHVTAQMVREALRQGDLDEEQGNPRRQVINIRVAGPNAGHTVYDDQGNRFALRQIPVAAAISDQVLCYIAPGSEVDLQVVRAEVHLLREAGHNPVLAVSEEATVLESRHQMAEQDPSHGQAGSTKKGIGAARADRLMRKAWRVKDVPAVRDELHRLGFSFAEPADLYATDDHAESHYQHLIIEGTQGYGLGLHAGGYPYTTSSDCTALDFMAMAGVGPLRAGVVSFRVWVVVRAFPIRIAGESGPMEGETSWEALGLPEEYTTVTQKVRRVGAWDGDLVRRAVQANGGHSNVLLALTMADQLFPEIAGMSGEQLEAVDPRHREALEEWVVKVQEEVGAPVAAITTSPTTIAWNGVYI